MKKKEEIDLLPDKELFSAILEVSSEAIWVRDFKKGQAYWLASKENKKKYGFPANVIEGDFWERQIHPDDRAIAVRGYQDAFNDSRVKEFVHHYRFIGKKSIEYIIEDRIKFIRDKKGKVTRVTGVWRDVTETNKKNHQLQKALNRLKNEHLRINQISEVTSMMMWECNLKTRRMTWLANKKILDDFKLSGAKFTMDDWEKSICEEDRDRVIQNFKDAVNSGRNDFFETYRVIKADGSLAFVIDQGKIIRDKKGTPVQAYGGWIDVTKERERETILEKTLEEQRALVRTLATHEQELRSTEEELRQMNEQLKVNLDQLEEREFVLNQSQRLAKIGSWEYDIIRKRMTWSPEMYHIYGVDNDFNVNDLNEILQLYDEPSSRLVAQTFQNILVNHDLPFDITAQIKTPLGYRKWIRMTAHPLVEDKSLQRILGITTVINRQWMYCLIQWHAKPVRMQ